MKSINDNIEKKNKINTPSAEQQYLKVIKVIKKEYFYCVDCKKKGQEQEGPLCKTCNRCKKKHCQCGCCDDSSCDNSSG